MASIVNDPNGRKRILFVAPDESRKAIRLGKIDRKGAEAITRHIENLLSSKINGQPIQRETSVWLTTIGDSLRTKLAAVGLIESTEKKSLKLGQFLDTWIAERKGDYKPASIIAWGQVVQALKEFYGADCLLTKVNRDKAEAFRQFLLKAELRATTIHKRLQHARMFFEHAKRQGLVDSNPFELVRHRPGDAAERRAYVPAEDVMRVIDHAPNWVWKLLIALSRFAGLRVPSEALSLRWQDIDWDRGRITVPSPKTQHLAGRGYRVIPLFPEVRPYLDAAWDEAPDRTEYVIPEQYRQCALGPAGWSNANLRTTFYKIIRRAGLEAWPRLWHAMRASCETDLARRFPLAVVAKWLGNTVAVAMRHYVDVTDADFERAATGAETTQEKAAQKAAQSVAVLNRGESRGENAICENNGDSPISRRIPRRGVEAAGIGANCVLRQKPSNNVSS